MSHSRKLKKKAYYIATIKTNKWQHNYVHIANTLHRKQNAIFVHITYVGTAK
jgi:hypothetical protein